MAARKGYQSTRGMLMPVGVFTVVLILVLLYVGERVCAVQLAVYVDKQQALRDRLVEEVNYLRVRHASLSSSKRIEEYARTRLGMISPPPGSIIYLVRTSDGSIQLPEKLRR